jgi:predicted DNA-binding transcriptional regulator YafY
MSVQSTLIRYNSIINHLRSSPYATFEELLQMLNDDSNLEFGEKKISLRTFQRDIHVIERLFGVEILCRKSDSTYYIEENTDDARRQRLLESFDILSALKTYDQLGDRVLFESRRPRGAENLHGLLNAIQNNIQVAFVYEKYWDGDISQRTVLPYLLKESDSRWYLLAKDMGDGRVKTFGLDRISGLRILAQTFTLPKDFVPSEVFKHCYGIIGESGKQPKKVVLSFSELQGKYVKSLPLHHSQKTLIDNHDELRIELTVHISEDFVMKLLSYSGVMKVLEPASLQSEIIDKIKDSLMCYGYLDDDGLPKRLKHKDA